MTSIRRTVAGWVNSIADRSPASSAEPTAKHKASGGPSVGKRVAVAGLATTGVMGLLNTLGVGGTDIIDASIGSAGFGPGARLVPGEDGFTAEERPTWTVGKFTFTGATESERQAFTPEQARVYGWMTGFAKHGNVELATKLARMARPAPDASEAPATSFMLDATAMDRVIAGFQARGVNISDQGLARQFEMLRMKMPERQGKLVEVLFEKGQRLHVFEPGSLSPEQKRALKFLEDKSNRWIKNQRESFGFEAPGGALGRQETTRGAVAIGPKLLSRIYKEHLAPRSDHRVTEVAMDWIRHPRVNDNTGRVDWNDWCQAFVWRVFAEAGHHDVAPGGDGIIDSAKDAYLVAKARGLTRTDWKNLKGNAALYWDVRTNGHTAIALDKMGPDGKPLVAMTGSVLWYSTPMAKVITWTEMVRVAGHPTAYTVAWDPDREQP